MCESHKYGSVSVCYVWYILISTQPSGRNFISHARARVRYIICPRGRQPEGDISSYSPEGPLGPRAIRNSAREASRICDISTSRRLSRSFSFQQSQQINVQDFRKIMLLLVKDVQLAKMTDYRTKNRPLSNNVSAHCFRYIF